MKVDFREHEAFLYELCSMKQQGTELFIENCPATPVEIVLAHFVQEGVEYMRDYISDEEGRVVMLYFNRIR